MNYTEIVEKSDDSTKTDNQAVEFHVIVFADEEEVITLIIITDNIVLIYHCRSSRELN